MMKKILLLIMVAGLVAGPSFGQASKNQSIVFLKEANSSVAPKIKTNIPVEELTKHSNPRAAGKTTAVTQGWFNYVNLMYRTGTTVGYYYPLYHDSNLRGVDGQGTPYFVGSYGMGISFDPTDSLYSGGDANGQTSAGAIQDFTALPPFRVTGGNAYTVDSVDFLGKYMRRQNHTNPDTLFVDIVKTSPSTTGVYSLQYNTPSANFYNISADGRPRFATAAYDPATNKVSSIVPGSNIVRLSRLLTANYFADSNANGYHNTTFALPTPMSVSPGEVVIIYVSFRSSVSYPLSTDVNSANTFRTYSYEIGGTDAWPKQTVGSYQSGLVATKQSKYTPPYDSFAYDNKSVLIPSVAYSNEAGNDAPFFAVYVNCPTCFGLDIAKTSNIISYVKAYPNPANTEVNVPFTLSSSADVNVKLSNPVGQLISAQSFSDVKNGNAVFSTASLTSGIYFISVEADGQVQTTRVVVTH